MICAAYIVLFFIVYLYSDKKYFQIFLFMRCKVYFCGKLSILQIAVQGFLFNMEALLYYCTEKKYLKIYL